MTISTDPNKAKQLVQILFHTFRIEGIFGRNEMPEDLLPKGIARGSLDHLLFITLTVAVDYQRDAISLWNASRKTFEDPATRYLYDPKAVHEAKPSQIIKDMLKHGLSKKSKKDAYIWRTNALTFYKKWNGNPLCFIEDCNWDAPSVLKRLKTDTHLYSGKAVADYPFLRGDKIGPLWIRMLRDNIGIDRLKGLDHIPIPVDIHIARASLCLGVLKGTLY